MKKKLYISLPITGRPIEEAMSDANEARAFLERYGYDVVTPFDVSPDSDKPYSYHMGRDIEALLECDYVFFCRGWQLSKGCMAEFEVARIYGKKLIFE